MVKFKPAYVITILVATIAFIGANIAATIAVNTPESEPVIASQTGIIERTAVIRLGTTVYLHTNSAHGSIGITSINLSGGCRLVVNMDLQPGEKVLQVDAEEDEFMAKLGVQAGGSGGLGSVTIYLYRAGKEVCAHSSIFGTTSNVWLEVTSEIPTA